MKLKLSHAVPALVFASVVVLGGCASTATSAEAESEEAEEEDDDDVTREEVLAAQKAWCEALVMISTTADDKGPDAAKVAAEGVIDSAYGYNLGPVLFKPTLTVAPQTFRTTREGALSYFVGQNPDYPSDTGFALKHWRSCASENAAIFMDDDVAMSMGNVTFTDKDGNVTVVDKTWGYEKDDEGNLRIVLHHSSLPYKPN